MSSPVSLFGHTFLALHHEDLPEPGALVLEFGGTVDRPSDHLGALVDSIPGRFSASYFSYKEREYFADRRSLWVFPLRLHPEALERLKRQVQAVIGLERPYTFLRRNCSHYILALVAEAAGIARSSPEWPFVVPVDTLRVLDRHGLLAAPVYRPAPSARAEAAHDALSPVDRSRFESFRRDPDQPSDESEHSPLAQALSAAAEHWALVELQAGRRDAWYRLKRRFPVAARSDTATVDPLATGAHATWTLVRALDGAASTLGWSYGFLSFGQEDRSGLRNAELQLLELVVSRRAGRLHLERLGLLSMEANRPADHFGPGFTQRLDIAYVDHSAVAGRRSETLLLRFGRGLTWRLRPVDVTALPFVALGAVQGGAGWSPTLTAGLRGSAYVALPAGWRARAAFDRYGRSRSGLRSLHRLELASPSGQGPHSVGLQLELRKAEGRHVNLGLRWSYRPGIARP